MKVSWHQIPGGPEIRVYLISQEEFDRRRGVSAGWGTCRTYRSPGPSTGGTFPGGNDLN